MFLGWYDPDKKTPARYKLEDALDRYARKFGRAALTCITSPEDAAELEADKDAPSMPVRGVGFIPRYTFYVGIDEEAEAVVQPVAGTVPGTGERKSVRRKPPAVDLGSQETSPVVTTRRRSVAKTTAPPAPKPRAKQPVTEPVVEPVARRAKTVTEPNPKPARPQPDQEVKREAKRATPDKGVKPGTKRATTEPGVKPGTTRPKSATGVKSGTTRAKADSVAKSGTGRAKTDNGVKTGAKRTKPKSP